jgi:hypothetical protein
MREISTMWTFLGGIKEVCLRRISMGLGRILGEEVRKASRGRCIALKGITSMRQIILRINMLIKAGLWTLEIIKINKNMYYYFLFLLLFRKYKKDIPVLLLL